jgi:hypothetical protein
MKKTIIIIASLVVLLATMVSATSSDAYNRYAWQEYYGTSDSNTYLLRGSATNLIDRDTQSYYSCTAPVNAGNYGVYPTKFVINGNTYAGLIVPSLNAIHVVGANCTDFDSISTGGNIVSPPYVRGYYLFNGITPEAPEFTFLVKDSVNSHIYLRFFSINLTTSRMYLRKQVDTGLTDETNIAGLAGGCTGYNTQVCGLNNTIYAYWYKTTNTLYVLEGDETSPRAFNLTSSSTLSSITNLNQNRLNIWMDDWNADKYQEIIIAGLIDGESVYGSDYVGYYSQASHNITKVSGQQFGILGYAWGNGHHIDGSPDMLITPCQIGARGSSLEYCFKIPFIAPGSFDFVGIVDNSYSVPVFLGGNVGITPMTPVVYDINNDGFLDYGAPYNALYDYRWDWISGLDYSTLSRYSNILPIAYGGMRSTAFMYDLYPNPVGVHGGAGIVFSNGEAWQFLNNGSLLRTADWDTTLTNSTVGYITAGDINGDNTKELIFSNSNALFIHTNNQYEPPLVNLNLQHCTWNHPPTSQECALLDAGRIAHTNDCTVGNITSCNNEIAHTSYTTTPSTPTFTSPSRAYTNSNLTLSAGAGSVNNASETITYYYEFNDTNDASTLQAWSTNRTFDCDISGCNVNDVIRGYTKAVAITSSSSASSAATITIKSVPVISIARIDPTIAYTTTNLQGYCEAADADNELLTYYYKWYNGTTLYASGQDSGGNTPSVEKNIGQILNTYVDKGDSWILSCKAYDGFSNSAWLNSSAKVIQNKPPTILSVIIPTTTPYGTVIIVNSTTDADGDSITYETKWYINNSYDSLYDNYRTITSGLDIGETYRVGLFANDGYGWTNETFSNIMTIQNSTMPSYVSGSPTSGVVGTQFRITITYSDIVNITKMTFSMKDPDNIVVFNNALMSYYQTKLNQNGSKNISYSQLYTPTKAGTYSILNSTATNVDNNTFVKTIGTHNIVVSPAPVSPGGGGGTTIIGEQQTFNFTLTPNVVFFTSAPGTQRTMEFTLTNLELEDIIVKLTLEGAGDQSNTWVKFQDGSTITYVNVTKSQGLQSNKRLVRYTIDVPNDAIEQQYHFNIVATSQSTRINYNATMTVGESFWTWFGKDLVSYDIKYCADNSFTTTSTTCQNPSVFKLGFGLTEIVILVVIGLAIMFYFEYRDTGKRRRR